MLNTNKKPVANTKLGMVAPRVDRNMSSRSTNLFCRSAAIIPKNTPTRSTMAEAQIPMVREYGNPEEMMSLVVSPFFIKEIPKSPWA